MLAGKSFLVTGATGRIGADLVPRLEELGATVVPLVLPGYPREPGTVPWTAEAQPLPMFAPKDLRRLPPIDHVLNLHWKVNRSLSFSDQVQFEVTGNVLTPSFLWDWIREREVKSLVNCSSIRVFSPRNQSPVSFRTEPEPNTPYGVAKLFGEKFLSAFLAGASTTVSHLRLCSVCSYGENPAQIASRLAVSVLEGERIVINTGHRANLMYIDDAVDVLINCALSGENRPYLAVAPARTTDDLARLFEKTAGKPVSADYRDLAPGVGDLEYDSDLDTLRAPWTRVTPLEDAFARILEKHRDAKRGTS